ncbi:hypothetical protein RRSWK_06780 [Rhodopirellula sp. SWK7]|nr:hypothetical protein RRSWK_06780 [Rhodopirellula sp. SWK7]
MAIGGGSQHEDGYRESLSASGWDNRGDDYVDVVAGSKSHAKAITNLMEEQARVSQ